MPRTRFPCLVSRQTVVPRSFVQGISIIIIIIINTNNNNAGGV